MARPLEFKRRVQLSERDLDPKPPRARARSTPLVLGALAYACAFGLAWGVSTDRLRIGETFTRWFAPPAEAKTKSRADAIFSPPRVELEAALPAKAPVALPALAAPSEHVQSDEPSARAPEPDEPHELDVQKAVSPELAVERPEAGESSEPAKPATPIPSPAPLPPAPKQVASGGSCEAAIAAYAEDANQKAPKDLAAADFGRVLNQGDYLNRCGVPATTAVDICVAVQNGRALGVTVSTAPSNSKLDRCLSRVLRGVSFPSHPRMDVVRTRFSN